jgi:hypothetical protein
MFKLNYPTKTKSGEILTPFLAEGEMVYCFGKSGKTIIKKLTDFNFGVEHNNSTIVVTPVLEESDELFDPEPIASPPPTIITERKEEVIVQPPKDKGMIDNEEYV